MGRAEEWSATAGFGGVAGRPAALHGQFAPPPADDPPVDHRRQITAQDMQVRSADRGRIDPHDASVSAPSVGRTTSSHVMAPGP
jgi:hypothetical protein